MKKAKMVLCLIMSIIFLVGCATQLAAWSNLPAVNDERNGVVPHPFASVLQGYFADGEEIDNIKAFLIDIDYSGSQGMLVIQYDSTLPPHLQIARGRVYYLLDGELFCKYIGTDVGNKEHGSITAVTVDGNRLAAVVYDFCDCHISGIRSYTLFRLCEGRYGRLGEDFTIVHIGSGSTLDGEDNYYIVHGGRIHGGRIMLEHWNMRQPITQEEFYAIRTRYGLENTIGVWEVDDETEYILAMTMPVIDLSASVTLPFYNYTFILTPSYFEEWRDINFRYAAGRQVFGDYDGSFFVADNFQEYILDFIDIMNSINPVLVDAVTLDVPSGGILPFELFAKQITHDNYLYNLTISDFFFRMRVHKTEYFGYLYFFIHEWEILADGYYGSQWLVLDNLRHHSLYRISLCELDKIRAFADELEKSEVLWTATPAPTPAS